MKMIKSVGFLAIAFVLGACGNISENSSDFPTRSISYGDTEINLLNLESGEILASQTFAEDEIVMFVRQLENGYSVAWVAQEDVFFYLIRTDQWIDNKTVEEQAEYLGIEMIAWEDRNHRHLILNDNLELVEYFDFDGFIPFLGFQEEMNRNAFKFIDGELFAYSTPLFSKASKDIVRYNVGTGEVEVIAQNDTGYNLLIEEFVDENRILVLADAGSSISEDNQWLYGIFNIKTGEFQLITQEAGFFLGRYRVIGENLIINQSNWLENPPLNGAIVTNLASRESIGIPLQSGDSEFTTLSVDGNYIITFNRMELLFSKYNLSGEVISQVLATFNLESWEVMDVSMYQVSRNSYTIVITTPAGFEIYHINF
ncbi:MAG: hypothetical protein FWF59_03430 [Turicibacter sp.]|nr:hypothetical protein [Turicibacter sp.]